MKTLSLPIASILTVFLSSAPFAQTTDEPVSLHVQVTPVDVTLGDYFDVHLVNVGEVTFSHQFPAASGCRAPNFPIVLSADEGQPLWTESPFNNICDAYFEARTVTIEPGETYWVGRVNTAYPLYRFQDYSVGDAVPFAPGEYRVVVEPSAEGASEATVVNVQPAAEED